MDFSITILLKKKSDDFQWLFTSVYGPVVSKKRSSFLTELQNIYNLGHDAWLITGDFNMLRKKYEKQGKSFDFVVSSRFHRV